MQSTIRKRSMTKFLNTVYAIVLIILACSALTACDSDSPEAIDINTQTVTISDTNNQLNNNKPLDKIYYFGFDLRGSPQDDARQYLPFLKYLEASTGYKFKLQFTPKDGSITSKLGNNDIQFAALGAVSYIKAAQQYDVVPLTKGLNKDNKAEYRSYIVVPLNSPIKELQGLRYKRFAFGSESSTQGHLIPRIILSNNDLALEDFSRYVYTGSHQKCAEAILADKADACGMQDTLAEKLAGEKKIRVLHTSDFYPSSGIVANGKLDKEVLSRVKEALINFEPKGKHAEGLHRWHLTEMPNGFIAANTGDYADLKKWLLTFNMIEARPEK